VLCHNPMMTPMHRLPDHTPTDGRLRQYRSRTACVTASSVISIPVFTSARDRKTVHDVAYTCWNIKSWQIIRLGLLLVILQLWQVQSLGELPRQTTEVMGWARTKLGVILCLSRRDLCCLNQLSMT